MTKWKIVMFRLVSALALTILIAAPAAASPLTLDFENLVTAAVDYVPNGYGGVDWESFEVRDNSRGVIGTGYNNGQISGHWVGFNDAGFPAAISKSAGFDLYDGYFTAAWRDNLTLEVLGFRHGSQAYDTVVTLNSSGPTLVTFNYVGVDYVRFVASGGVNVISGGDGTHFAVDNLRLAPAPIPATLPLFASALGGLAFVARRKRRAAE
jgi:hypothetical protein